MNCVVARTSKQSYACLLTCDFMKKASIIQADNPKTFRALKVVASAISSGVLFKYAAIISTVTGKEQGSFR